MNTFLGITFETLVILGLVAANGFFVAAEFALVKVRSSQLRPLVRKGGGWRVKFALRATEHLDAALSATQLGITLASLGLGWIGADVELVAVHHRRALRAHAPDAVAPLGVSLGVVGGGLGHPGDGEIDELVVGTVRAARGQGAGIPEAEVRDALHQFDA